MRIVNARDLGLYVRDRRRHRRQTQTELAAAARVTRRWLADLEAGKPTIQIGLVFRTLDALGLVLDAQSDEPGPEQLDLDEHLRRLGEQPATGDERGAAS
ncbi:MAG: helix-turn-helix domain-containing protein [Natronosporangium sp.]